VVAEIRGSATKVSGGGVQGQLVAAS
jgi:hypothetical protein